MNNIKIKYLLGVHRDNPDYPTEEDMIFEISNFCLSNKQKHISDIDMKQIFKKDNIDSIVEYLKSKNIIIFDKELKTKINYKVIDKNLL